MVIFLIAPHAHAVAHKQPLASMLLSIGFSIVFCLTLLFVLLLFTNFIVDGLISVLRIWYPNLCCYRRPEDANVTRVPHHVIKKVALDFIFEQQRVATMPVHSRTPVVAEAMKGNAPVPKPVQDALYALVRFRNGRLDQPEYLCRKHSVKGVGLRTAWANLTSERLLMPRSICERWLTILPDAILVPVGATARAECASDLDLLRMYEQEDVLRGADYVAS